ncbi:MAG: alcohol dehydrogenase [Verrucomicrobia bacterium]|nr:MAG: alcohol dehydrogenase [Verrucomicrobiota bacterium]
MDAISLHQPREFRSIQVPEPGKPGPGEALVATQQMGICGTDRAGYWGQAAFWKYPNIIGHELGVRVLSVGEGVTQVQPGDRCSVEPYLNCGHCFACRRGRTNCCESLQVLGIMTEGGLRERFLLPAHKLHPSASLSFEALALVETLAIGCHATNQAAPLPGDHALLIGAGPIGLATLEFLRLTGAQVTVLDRDPARLEFVRQTDPGSRTLVASGDASQTAQIEEITGGDRFAVVIDATGNAESMSHAFSFVAQSGTLVYVGLTTKEIHFAQPVMHRPEVTLKASRNALPHEFTRIIGLLETGTIRVEAWITHRTSFRDVAADFERITDPACGVIKAMIDVTQR